MITKEEMSNLGNQIARHSMVATGYLQVSQGQGYNAAFMFDNLQPKNNDDNQDNIVVFNNNNFPKQMQSLYDADDQHKVFDFAVSRLPKSFLLSAFVGDKFYEQEKKALITFAKALAERDATTNWHMKVITHRQKPFALLNVFLTNTANPQIVHLGYRIGDLLLMLYPTRMNANMSLITALDHLTYLQTVPDPKAMFRKRLQDLQPQNNLEPIVTELTKLYQKSLEQKHLIYSQRCLNTNKRTREIENLDINALFEQYYNRFDCNELLTEFVNLSELASQNVQNKPEINLLLNKLMAQLS